MKNDETIDSIIFEIKEELENEGIELAEQEIFELVNSQFIGGAVAVKKRISFMISYIGNFVFKDLKSYVTSVKEVNKLKDQVSEEEYQRIIKEKRIANKDTLNGSKIPLSLNIDELPEDVTGNIAIKKYAELYSKVIEGNHE